MSDPNTARAAVLRDPNFRWLLGGGLISMLGDQFSMIALPWLVLKLTGDPLALGLVVALMSVPRALLILFGGALVDRHSPRRILMQTKYVNALLLGALAALVLSGHASLPLVATLALAIGIATAFSIPSGTAILPTVVPAAHLAQANGILMGMRQVTMLAGPLLAALLFAVAGDGSTPSGVRGLGVAFALDCASFVVSAWTLAKVRPQPGEHGAPGRAAQPILHAVAEGLRTVWQDGAMRTAFVYWAIGACVMSGVMSVGLPVLASTRLHGASALGVLTGTFSAGTLAGMMATSVAGRLRLGNLGTTLLVIDMLCGALVPLLGQVSALWQGALLFALSGMLAGFMQVAVLTWIQQRVPRAMLGRAMSIFMFIFMGVAPLSSAVFGWVMRYATLAQLFTGAGLLLVGIAALAWAFTPMRALVDAPGVPAAAMETAAREMAGADASDTV
jgi:MFS family permease